MRKRRNVSVSSLAKVGEKSVPSRLVQVRSRIDIMACILNEAIKGASKTRIIFRCNLSYRQLQPYLKLLLGVGLMGKEEGGKTDLYKTTAKGRSFIDAYRKLKALMA